MSRPKPFLTYFILCAVPLLVLAGLNYWTNMRTVRATVGAIVQNDLNSFTVGVDESLNERRTEILRLAISPAVQNFLIKRHSDPLSVFMHVEGAPSHLATLGASSAYFQTVTLFDATEKPLCYRRADGEWSFIDAYVANLPQPDERLWNTQGNVLLEKPGITSATIAYSAPVHDEKAALNVGGVVGVLDLQRVFATAARGLESRSNKALMVIVTDRSGKTLYHTDRTLTGEAQSAFDPDYATASAPIPSLDVAATIGRRLSDFTSGAHVWGVTGLVLALLFALTGAFMLDRHVQRRSRGIARVTEDLSAIAKGELDRRIVLQSSDDARVLADNINVVTERLRVQIAREEESRQFDSFVRLSAMLTHDLKNAIEGLSLTVGNMERHFDNPQFRTDALKGLTSATDKLRAIVARLARPLTTLSGEHKRPTNVDLVPIMQRVIAMNAEPTRGKHTIVARLPANLYALADPARIEEVMENLVLNALEAMDKSGTLTIEAGHTASGAPTFSVSDTGRGMSRAFIDTQLFRPFSTTKKTGIGLGLYTCREVIKANAGTIEVDSVEGAGTTFRVVLPSLPNDQV